MKKLFLTGSSGSIGSAVLSIFREKKYHITAPARSELNLENIDSIDKYFSQVLPDFDTYVHCAGENNPACIEDLDIEKIVKTININTFSFYAILKRIIPYLKNNGGSIVAISSLYGNIARSGRSAYVMSKHALNGLVKTAAIELGKYNVKVNSVSPGFVDTAMTRKNNSEDKIKTFEEQIPLGYLAGSNDIATVVYFLCSNENTYITGQDITVDGGFICGGFQR